MEWPQSLLPSQSSCVLTISSSLSDCIIQIGDRIIPPLLDIGVEVGISLLRTPVGIAEFLVSLSSKHAQSVPYPYLFIIESLDSICRDSADT